MPFCLLKKQPDLFLYIQLQRQANRRLVRSGRCAKCRRHAHKPAQYQTSERAQRAMLSALLGKFLCFTLKREPLAGIQILL
jgi:hypothetical protein